MLTKIITLTGVVLSQPVWAELVPIPYALYDGVVFKNNAALDYGYNNNITNQKYNNKKISGEFLTVSPVLSIEEERSQDRYFLIYNGHYRHYTNNTADDYNDHQVRLESEWRYGRMNRLALNYEESLGHEERGQGVSEGLQQEQLDSFGINNPLKTKFINGELRYSYGAAEGRGKIDLALQYKKYTFTNTRHVLETDSDYYDYIHQQEWSDKGLTAELVDRYTARTTFKYSFIANQRHYKYLSDKDSDEYLLNYNLKTQLTGKTNLNLNLSWQNKKFKSGYDAGRVNGLNWDFSTEWQPSKQSAVSLHTSKYINDATEVGEYVLAKTYGLSFRQKILNDNLLFFADYSHVNETYKNQDGGRRDRSRVLNFTLNYDYSPKVSFSACYQHNRRASNKNSEYFYIGNNSGRAVMKQLGFDNSMITFEINVQI